MGKLSVSRVRRDVSAYICFVDRLFVGLHARVEFLGLDSSDGGILSWFLVG